MEILLWAIGCVCLAFGTIFLRETWQLRRRPIRLTTNEEFRRYGHRLPPSTSWLIKVGIVVGLSCFLGGIGLLLLSGFAQ